MSQFRHLLCPVCRQKLTLNGKSAVCPRGHNFDRARQGYLNLHLSPGKTQYTKALYLARQHLFNNGVFDPLVTGLSALLLRHTSVAFSTALDAGCGDGSLLAALVRTLTQHNHTPAGLGIDICKDAVKIASRSYPALTWCVADLAKLPVADHTQDIIINILAPANYSEFARLLTPTGVLAKVQPGPEHFKEIRQALQTPDNTQDSQDTQKLGAQKPDTQKPDTQKSGLILGASVPVPKFCPTEPPPTMAHAEPYFTVIETHRLTYDVAAAGNIEHFIHMSPLSWHTLPERKDSALSGKLQSIRLDYILVLARHKT